MLNLRIVIKILGILLFSHQITNAKVADQWEVDFSCVSHSINLGSAENINIFIYNLNKERLMESNGIIRVVSSDPRTVEVSKIISPDEIREGRWSGSFTAVPISLNSARVWVEIEMRPKMCSIIERSHNSMEINVLRNHNIININRWFSPQFRFYFMHISFVVLNVAFGAALDINKLKAILQYPIGPCVGFMFDLLLYPLVC